MPASLFFATLSFINSHTTLDLAAIPMGRYTTTRMKEEMMTEIKRSIIIKAPVEKVFKYVSDFQTWPDWYEGVSKFTPITQKTRGNGTKYVYKAKLFGINATVGTEITQFKENEGWVGKSFKGFEHKTHWNFKELNGNTEFTHCIIFKVPWYMGGKFSDNKLLKPAWEKIVENSLQNLKELLEKT